MKNEELVLETLAETFACNREQISMATTPDDIPSWDSLGHMNLITNLQNRLGIDFELDEVIEMNSVSQIVTVLERRSH